MIVVRLLKNSRAIKEPGNSLKKGPLDLTSECLQSSLVINGGSGAVAPGRRCQKGTKIRGKINIRNENIILCAQQKLLTQTKGNSTNSCDILKVR